MLIKKTQLNTFLILLVCLLSLTSCKPEKKTEQILAEQIARQNDWLRQQNEQLMKVEHHPHGGYIFGILLFAILASPGVFLLILFMSKSVREPLVAAFLERRQYHTPPKIASRVQYEDVTPESSSADKGVNVEAELKDEKAEHWEAAVKAFRRKQKTREELGDEATDEISIDYLRRIDNDNNDGY